MSELLRFIDQNKDWEAMLTGMGVSVRHDGEYTLLKYRDLGADFGNPVIRECRGSIIKFNGNTPEFVCRPFDKFGNYGESYADTENIDWDSATVSEKIDGSLMKVWFDNGWHLSTMGIINAFTFTDEDQDHVCFGEVFKRALTNNGTDFGKLTDGLDKGYTY